MKTRRYALVLAGALVLYALPAGAESRPKSADAAADTATADEPTTDEPTEPTAAPSSKPRPRTRLDEVVVEATKPFSAASSDEIRARDYELRPHGTVFEILNNVPGLVVAQHQGGGKAPQWLVRGFDADHGTDFAVSVDELPINLVTHGHGQGYADVNPIIPEVVERLQLRKGPYFADLGDFATAGGLNFVTRDEFKENFLLAEGGSFDTMRYVGGASHDFGGLKLLGAVQAYSSNGPFEDPQNYGRYNGYLKATMTPSSTTKLQLALSLYQGDWDGSGQIPEREVAAGRLDRFGSFDPTEGGRTDREDMSLHYTWKPRPEEEYGFQLYGSRYKLALWSDFTLFKDTGLRFTRNGRYIPGDGIEQNDKRWIYGARAHYQRFWSLFGTAMAGKLGVETRNDDIQVSLHRQVRRQRFFTVNQVAVSERSVGTYLTNEVFLTDWARFEFGLRGDVFTFDGRNRLPRQKVDPNFKAVLISGSTSDSIISPKANLILSPLDDTEVYLNFGEGFHSNDARNALLGKGSDFSPLVKALGYEIGARTKQFDRLELSSTLWLLDLKSELVFSGDGGNQETGAGGSFAPAGPSRRWGVDLEARYDITDWLTADYDLTWADPRFKNGDAIPLAPTLLMNGGLTAQFDNGFSVALRSRFLDDRPAIEDRSLTARGYFLLDLIARYRWRNVEASLAFLNLTNTDWREAQFADTSCVRREVGNARNPNCLAAPGFQGEHPDPHNDVHYTPGIPFGVRAGLKIYFN